MVFMKMNAESHHPPSMLLQLQSDDKITAEAFKVEYLIEYQGASRKQRRTM